jgi:hypothetical protein
LNVTGWDVWGIWKVKSERRVCRIVWGDRSGRSHLEELAIDKMELLKLIFKKGNGAGK